MLDRQEAANAALVMVAFVLGFVILVAPRLPPPPGSAPIHWPNLYLLPVLFAIAALALAFRPTRSERTRLAKWAVVALMAVLAIAAAFGRFS